MKKAKGNSNCSVEINKTEKTRVIDGLIEWRKNLDRPLIAYQSTEQTIRNYLARFKPEEDVNQAVKAKQITVAYKNSVAKHVSFADSIIIFEFNHAPEEVGPKMDLTKLEAMIRFKEKQDVLLSDNLFIRPYDDEVSVSSSVRTTYS
jgi:hypothetical protein